MPRGDGTGPGGLGRGRGRGIGRRMGRGMGRGRGMGVDAGFAQESFPEPQTQTKPQTRDDEPVMLKQQTQTIGHQMQQVQERVGRLSDDSKIKDCGMTAKVDVKTCMGCGFCVGTCPIGAMELIDDVAVVDVENCTGCGACVDACPNGAISLV